MSKIERLKHFKESIVIRVELSYTIVIYMCSYSFEEKVIRVEKKIDFSDVIISAFEF